MILPGGLARLLAATLLALGLAGCSTAFQPMGPSVEVARMTDAELVAPDGFRLPLRRWAPPEGVPVQGVILALHGFNDYSNAFDGAGRWFAGRGLVTYAYDQRGFGATRNPGIWAGADTMVADLRMAAELLRTRHPIGTPFYLLGESMGGAVILTALAGPRPPRADGAILVAPAVWGFDSMGFLPRTALRLSYAAVPGWVVHPPRELNIQPSDNIEMLRALGRDPLVIKGSRVDALYGLTELMGRAMDACGHLRTPALVLYGRHEQVLPSGPVETAMAELRSSARNRVALYPKGYHMLLRDLSAEVVLADIVHWIGNPSEPLLSGADRTDPALVAAR